MASEATSGNAREQALKRLAHEAARGVMTLDEYAERAAAAERAATPEEIATALKGVGEEPDAGAPAQHRTWIVGVLGGSEQRGRWRLSRRMRVIALLGGAKLDLGQAEPEAPESAITVVAVLGGVEMTAPPGLPIQLSGVSLLGGKSDERPAGPALPGAPLVRVRAFTFLGGVKVTSRKSPP